ncbi:ABC transporter ATP-binding protein [Methylocystis bryophila]|uniref:ABC transporter ATP-binding protein n=1 Tax=Methylocystis bryophila TaxID=655015 RepID=A0A1W6MRD9_9HYPH|nr:ABC transporter ATP-binding protein [Methylocystis bryophila]ARN80171.1 ABC transporter ATP-binding protein [Methylocystis bryophila]BDV40113.1 nitrate/sulfonate/bicarbonate ABC transporter ATP-binding protein [Methylocystis bryophila]
MTPLVSLRAVSKTFDNGAVVLDALDLDVFPGETLTLLGPSGCGKSTALRLIAGVASPTHGEISWSSEEARQGIGFVFQDATLLPWANVFANVYLPLRLAGVDRREAEPRVLDALAMVRLESARDAFPRELSGGMKMRCAIARALVTRPKLLLMDEPFAALDEVTRFNLNDELIELKRRTHTTIVFVTHSVAESVYLSTRVVVLSSGGGRVIGEIVIDPTAPRDAEFRLGAEFSAHARRASAALLRAMGQPQL